MPLARTLSGVEHRAASGPFSFLSAMSRLDEDVSHGAPEVLVTSGFEEQEGAAAERSGAIMVGQAAEERAAAIAAAYASGIVVRLSLHVVGGPVGGGPAAQGGAHVLPA